jgi:hypothetical protein
MSRAVRNLQAKHVTMHAIAPPAVQERSTRDFYGT